jgi:hypothetical protein
VRVDAVARKIANTVRGGQVECELSQPGAGGMSGHAQDVYVAAWRGIDARRGEDLPNGGGADLVAEPAELAVDGAIPPAGILGSEAHDQCADTGGDGGRPGRVCGVVQRRVGGVGRR